MNAGYLYVILCYVLVGASYPIAKDAMNDIPIWTFTAVTFLIAALMLIPLSAVVDKTRLTRINARSWLFISIQSLLGAVLYTAFLLYGFSYSSAITGSIVTSITPAVVLLLSAVLLKERLSLKKVLAIALGISGVLVLTLPAAGAEGSTSMAGFVFLLLSTLSSAGCVIAANRLIVDLPATTMAMGVCVTGFIFSLPMAISEHTLATLPALMEAHAGVLLYYAILVWAVPYILFYKGVTRIPASATGMAFSVIPIAATLFSVLFFNESLGSSGAIALLLVTASILLAESRQQETPDNVTSEALITD